MQSNRMTYPHRRTKCVLLSLVSVMLIFIILSGERMPSQPEVESAVDCPTDMPSYPSYRYSYTNTESKLTDCSIIKELRGSRTEAECPNLFIIGTRKGGTTSLYRYISQHPGFMGQGIDKNQSVGETHYFSFTFQASSWQHYMDIFRDRRGRATGESSVSYLPSCMSPFRMRALCGTKPAIVALLRDPVERLVSTYVMRYNRKNNREVRLQEYVEGSFRKDKIKWETVLRSNGLVASQLLTKHTLCLFKPARNQIYEGLYSIHLKRWLEYFPKGNFIIWKSEEFRKSPSYYLSQLIAQLGLQPLTEDELDRITSVLYNRNEYGSEVLSWEMRAYLRELYTPFNQQLEAVLGRRFDWDY